VVRRFGVLSRREEEEEEEEENAEDGGRGGAEVKKGKKKKRGFSRNETSRQNETCFSSPSLSFPLLLFFSLLSFSAPPRPPSSAFLLPEPYQSPNCINPRINPHTRISSSAAARVASAPRRSRP
jgi:hypothetical protein